MADVASPTGHHAGRHAHVVIGNSDRRLISRDQSWSRSHGRPAVVQTTGTTHAFQGRMPHNCFDDQGAAVDIVPYASTSCRRDRGSTTARATRPRASSSLHRRQIIRPPGTPRPAATACSSGAITVPRSTDRRATSAGLATPTSPTTPWCRSSAPGHRRPQPQHVISFGLERRPQPALPVRLLPSLRHAEPVSGSASDTYTSQLTTTVPDARLPSWPLSGCSSGSPDLNNHSAPALQPLPCSMCPPCNHQTCLPGHAVVPPLPLSTPRGLVRLLGNSKRVSATRQQHRADKPGCPRRTRRAGPRLRSPISHRSLDPQPTTRTRTCSDFPVASGTQVDLRLYFANLAPAPRRAQRVFNVTVNGSTVLSNFDGRPTAGAHTVTMKDLRRPQHVTGRVTIGCPHHPYPNIDGIGSQDRVVATPPGYTWTSCLTTARRSLARRRPTNARCRSPTTRPRRCRRQLYYAGAEALLLADLRLAGVFVPQ